MKKMQHQNPKLLKPAVWIGKNGIKSGVVNQIKGMLKQKRMIKVKFLRSFIDSNDREEAARNLASLTDSVIIEQTGFTVVLRRR